MREIRPRIPAALSSPRPARGAASRRSGQPHRGRVVFAATRPPPLRLANAGVGPGVGDALGHRPEQAPRERRRRRPHLPQRGSGATSDGLDCGAVRLSSTAALSGGADGADVECCIVIHEGPQGVKGVLIRGRGWLGAGSLTAVRLGKVLQSSIRSRWAGQSVVRCSGAHSSGRPSGVSEAMTYVELARACASRRSRGRRPCLVSARRGSCRQLRFRARAAAARQATDLSVA
jgi:hypothetical protein